MNYSPEYGGLPGSSPLDHRVRLMKGRSGLRGTVDSTRVAPPEISERGNPSALVTEQLFKSPAIPRRKALSDL